MQDRPADDQVHLVIPEDDLLSVHLDDRAGHRLVVPFQVRLQDPEQGDGQVARDHAGLGVQLMQGEDRVAAPRAHVEDPGRAGRVERQVTARRPQQVLPVGHVLIDVDVMARVFQELLVDVFLDEAVVVQWGEDALPARVELAQVVKIHGRFYAFQ